MRTHYILNAPPEIQVRLREGKKAHRARKRRGLKEYLAYGDALNAAQELASLRAGASAGAGYNTVHQAIIVELGYREMTRQEVFRFIWLHRNIDRIKKTPQKLGGLESNATAEPAMAVIGYARVSSRQQDLTLQQAALKKAGCDPIRFEKKTGTTIKGRTELQIILDFMREGDVLVVSRIDRLARSIGDLQDIMRQLKAKGVELRATEQAIDTTTAAGKCFVDMRGVFAEFETNLTLDARDSLRASRRQRRLEFTRAVNAASILKPSVVYR
jgi:hypothetical protein